ncbi:MAG: DUF5916 domain-containing protein [Gammaproteobacteria bacterium]|nr:DUF5916 domain-containing protein [Gammaproteobacteria bacterium]
MKNKLTSLAKPLAVMMLGANLSLAATAPTQPPVTTAARLQTAPNLDGDVLGDSAWSGLTPATGFWQTKPDEGRPATQKTEVFIGFTDDTLYFGIVCHDDDPDAIIISDSRRDSSLRDTDSFQVVLDSFKDRQNGFVFGTNPAGIEYDGQIVAEGSGGRSTSGGGFNLNWDTTWTVRAQVSDFGWSAEMAIPFKSLRYGSESVQSWGINFQRNIRRNNEVAFWSPLPRQYSISRISQAGTIEGLATPSQRNLKLTPYALAQRTTGGPSDDNHTKEEVGFDIKYSITPGLTLDATYNTDFAQVEADELQVNLDRFSLFLREKRPFFLENAGQFTVGNPREIELFFSRRIGIGSGGEQTPIDGGLRLSGKLGDRTNVGLLQMRSEAIDGVAPRNDYTVARVNQELANRSSIGFLVVNRDGDGSHLVANDDDHNTTYAFDGRWGIGETGTISGFVAKTDTPNLSGDDHAFNLEGRYRSERWNNSLAYTEVAENFNPEVGFLSRQAYRKISARVFRRIRPDNLLGLHEIRPHISYTSHWRYDDGFHESMLVHVDSHWEWETGFEVHTGVNFTHEGITDPFEIAEGVTVQPGKYDHEELQLVARTDQSAPLSFELQTRIGGRFGGDRITLEPEVKYRIGEKFTSELTWSYNHFELPGGDFTVNVGKLRATYSFTPSISIQALVQYDDRSDVVATNLRFAWLQSASAGLYLVYNEIDDRDAIGKPQREFILKYSRIFDLL